MMKYLLTLLTTCLFVFTTVNAQNIEVKQTGYQNSFGKLQMPSASCIYILDDIPSTLLSSLDGGKTWNSLALPSDSAIFRYDGIQFLNENIGFIWGVEGCHYTNGTRPALIKTTDKGKHWTVVKNNLPQLGVISSMQFFSETAGICFMPCTVHNGGHPEKYYTEDGGQTWSPIINYNYLYGEIGMIDFIDGLNGFATGSNNNLFFSKTEDGGLTWNSNVLNVMGGNGTGVKFFSLDEGMLVASDSIYKTFDAGDTWMKSKFPFSYNIAAFDFTDDGIGYFISDNNIYKTIDKCATWELFYTANNIYFSDIKIKDNVCIVAGTEGNVVKIDLSKTPAVAVNENNIKVFPNPTNGSVKVNYSLTENADVRIELYDVLGKQVLQLVNEMAVNTGNYSIALDMGTLNSGIYLLKSTIGDTSKATKIIKK